jgi:hypothetical protein
MTGSYNHEERAAQSEEVAKCQQMHAKTFAARRTLNSTNPRRPPRKERAQTGVATRCETPPVLEPAWTQAGPEARRDSG